MQISVFGLLSACATMDTQVLSSSPSVTTCLAVPCCITWLRWGAMTWTSEPFSSSHPWLLPSLPRNDSSDPPVTIMNGVLELNIRGMAISLLLSDCIYLVRAGGQNWVWAHSVPKLVWTRWDRGILLLWWPETLKHIKGHRERSEMVMQVVDSSLMKQEYCKCVKLSVL